ncbi:uncharacterized protein EV420DRAFT_1338523 [Desarmillaria tabescens]|uniref:Uncharacterized protein n=1 Tax=Armillaria tabescens TaxID=1929756 RepID=A0AA39JXJ5_ARMTA|nr:uncharacterized protein EV420DRAFT_1338523 [Desarmillaria tabescens]KAK0449670.1 hypothetical protein EV420DRAFT_1338523 [Desarmillaria tabescens]
MIKFSVPRPCFVRYCDQANMCCYPSEQKEVFLNHARMVIARLRDFSGDCPGRRFTCGLKMQRPSRAALLVALLSHGVMATALPPSELARFTKALSPPL